MDYFQNYPPLNHILLFWNSSGYNFNFHMHFNQKTARPAKNRNRNQAKYKSFIPKWRYIKFTLIKALRKDHPEHPRQIHAQEGKNKTPADILRLVTLIENYGTQLTLLTSFMSIISGTNHPILKLTSGPILTILPIVYCYATCALITNSNRRLVNYILRRSKG